MYFFGSPEDSAKMIITGIAATSGPGMSDKPLEECSKEEVRNIMVYRSAALRRAQAENADEELVSILTDMYEEALIEFCKYSDVIYLAMKAYDHLYPNNDPRARARQKRLVAQACGYDPSEN